MCTGVGHQTCLLNMMWHARISREVVRAQVHPDCKPGIEVVKTARRAQARPAANTQVIAMMAMRTLAAPDPEAKLHSVSEPSASVKS